MGCTEDEERIIERLKCAGLRPTRQRIALGSLLFSGHDRHVTAEVLHDEAVRNAIPVSLATVYNTLHQFTEAGLLRAVAIEGARTYFDTNISNHGHFYIEPDGALMDIQHECVPAVSVPAPPAGMAISRIDVLVRLVKKDEQNS